MRTRVVSSDRVDNQSPSECAVLWARAAFLRQWRRRVRGTAIAQASGTLERRKRSSEEEKIMSARGWTRALVVSLAALPFGCASGGTFPAATVTNVTLSNAGYRIVATDVEGEASAGYLLGVSASRGQEMTTLALARVKGDGMLYKRALQNLWANFETRHGKIEGRHLALVNVRFDGDALNVVGLYTRPKVSVRADVIEFTH